MTLVQALLIALVAAAGQAAGDIGGNVMVNRPIVLAPLVGAILGDLQQGLIMGAALELIFLGVVSIGGATPSDSNMGSVLGTAFAMSMHLSLIHISEPTRQAEISYAVFCLKKKKNITRKKKAE